MAINKPAAGDLAVANFESIHGIILRSSAAFLSRYAYLSLSRDLPTAVSGGDGLSAVVAQSLAAAPHFPDITILDSISGTVLYQTYSSFPADFFHVYNLFNRSHSTVSFPYRYPYVHAAMATHERVHFKVLVVCIEEQCNPLFGYGGDGAKPLVFFVYSSKARNWSRIWSSSSAFTSDQLLPNQRKPVHAGDDVVYLDLTDRFLVRFTSLKQELDPVPKLVSPWERDSMKLDKTTRFGGCKGWLHCVKFNPVKARLEVFVWRMEALKGAWSLAVAGKEGNLRGKVVLGIHPSDESLVFVRSKADDEISMVDIRRDLQWVVVGGRGPKCGEACFVKGMTDVLEAAMRGGEKLKRSGCGILHPHGNAEGPQGEIFIVSLLGT